MPAPPQPLTTNGALIKYMLCNRTKLYNFRWRILDQARFPIQPGQTGQTAIRRKSPRKNKLSTRGKLQARGKNFSPWHGGLSPSDWQIPAMERASEEQVEPTSQKEWQSLRIKQDGHTAKQQLHCLKPRHPVAKISCYTSIVCYTDLTRHPPK